MYAYAHAPIDEETITLTSFSSGDKLYSFTPLCVLLALKVRPICSQNKCIQFFSKTL